MNVARSRGFDVRFDDVGKGPAIVLVPGFAWPASTWGELGYVDRLVGSGYRVLTVDPLGHGLSDKPHDWQSYLAPDIATDIVAAMDAAGIRTAVLWGYSRGAALVTMPASESPGRVKALIVGGLTWLGTSATEDGTSSPADALKRGGWPAFWEELGPVSDADRHIMERSDPLAMAAVDLARARSTYVVDPGRVHVPTLLYYGSNDTWVPVEAAAEAFGIEPLMIPDGDHSRTFRDVDGVVPPVLRFLGDVDR